jgi:putative oxidoreductase
MQTLSRLFDTDPASTSLLAQRVVLGGVFVPHGAQKLLGWFGGYGWHDTMTYLTDVVHLPSPIAALVILGESLGSLALIAGAGTRMAAAWLAAILIGAVLTTHVQVGFFMDWAGTRHTEGFEYHLLGLALALPLIVRGGGRASLDAVFARRAS